MVNEERFLYSLHSQSAMDNLGKGSHPYKYVKECIKLTIDAITGEAGIERRVLTRNTYVEPFMVPIYIAVPSEAPLDAIVLSKYEAFSPGSLSVADVRGKDSPNKPYLSLCVYNGCLTVIPGIGAVVERVIPGFRSHITLRFNLEQGKPITIRDEKADGLISLEQATKRYGVLTRGIQLREGNVGALVLSGMDQPRGTGLASIGFYAQELFCGIPKDTIYVGNYDINHPIHELAPRLRASIQRAG
jgi:hypothetical protein